MSFLEDLEREVREDVAKALRRESHGERVAPTADRVENQAFRSDGRVAIHWG
jgi:hypothetical protein